MHRIGSITDLVSGLFLVGTALFALRLSWPLPFGTALHMGAGYVPQTLCYLQIALGCLIIVQSVSMSGDPWERWVPRPIVWILASVLFFAFAIERFGLVVSVIGLVVLSCLARPHGRLFDAVLLAIGLAIFSVLVFVTVLGLVIPVWPSLGM